MLSFKFLMATTWGEGDSYMHTLINQYTQEFKKHVSIINAVYVFMYLLIHMYVYGCVLKFKHLHVHIRIYVPRDLSKGHLQIFRNDYQMFESYIYYRDPKKIITTVENPKGLPLSCMLTYIGKCTCCWLRHYTYMCTCNIKLMYVHVGTRDDTTIEEKQYKGRRLYIHLCIHVYISICLLHIYLCLSARSNLLMHTSVGWHDLTTYAYPDWGYPLTSQPYGVSLRLKTGRNFYYHDKVFGILVVYIYIYMYTYSG